MCFQRRPLPHGWAWLKLCAECAVHYGTQGAQGVSSPPGAAAIAEEAARTQAGPPPEQLEQPEKRRE